MTRYAESAGLLAQGAILVSGRELGEILVDHNGEWTHDREYVTNLGQRWHLSIPGRHPAHRHHREMEGSEVR